jgi:nucleoside-diphosphate-sugar epimerase
VAKQRTLVTGAAGWTARAVLERLAAAGHRIVGLDVNAPCRDRPTDVRWVRADVSDAASIEAAFAGVTGVVHMAVAVGNSDYARADTPFRSNVLGTYNVFELARRHDVRRVVVIGSAPVHLPPTPTATATVWRSSSGDSHLYDLTKRLQEEIARDFAETFAMDAIVLRAGHIVDARQRRDPRGRPLEQVQYCRGGWVCRHDLAAAIEHALRAPLRGFHVFNIVGAASARTRFDVEAAERELGFTIEQRFEAYEP